MNDVLLALTPFGITTQYRVWLSMSGPGTVPAVIWASMKLDTSESLKPLGGLEVVMTAEPRRKPRPMPRYSARPAMYALASMVRHAAVICADVGFGGGLAVHALPQKMRYSCMTWRTGPP